MLRPLPRALRDNIAAGTWILLQEINPTFWPSLRQLCHEAAYDPLVGSSGLMAGLFPKAAQATLAAETTCGFGKPALLCEAGEIDARKVVCNVHLKAFPHYRSNLPKKHMEPTRALLKQNDLLALAAAVSGFLHGRGWPVALVVGDINASCDEVEHSGVGW